MNKLDVFIDTDKELLSQLPDTLREKIEKEALFEYEYCLDSGAHSSIIKDLVSLYHDDRFDNDLFENYDLLTCRLCHTFFEEGLSLEDFLNWLSTDYKTNTSYKMEQYIDSIKLGIPYDRFEGSINEFTRICYSLFPDITLEFCKHYCKGQNQVSVSYSDSTILKLVTLKLLGFKSYQDIIDFITGMSYMDIFSFMKTSFYLYLPVTDTDKYDIALELYEGRTIYLLKNCSNVHYTFYKMVYLYSPKYSDLCFNMSNYLLCNNTSDITLVRHFLMCDSIVLNFPSSQLYFDSITLFDSQSPLSQLLQRMADSGVFFIPSVQGNFLILSSTFQDFSDCNFEHCFNSVQHQYNVQINPHAVNENYYYNCIYSVGYTIGYSESSIHKCLNTLSNKGLSVFYNLLVDELENSERLYYFTDNNLEFMAKVVNLFYFIYNPGMSFSKLLLEIWSRNYNISLQCNQSCVKGIQIEDKVYPLISVLTGTKFDYMEGAIRDTSNKEIVKWEDYS